MFLCWGWWVCPAWMPSAQQRPLALPFSGGDSRDVCIEETAELAPLCECCTGAVTELTARGCWPLLQGKDVKTDLKVVPKVKGLVWWRANSVRKWAHIPAEGRKVTQLHNTERQRWVPVVHRDLNGSWCGLAQAVQLLCVRTETKTCNFIANAGEIILKGSCSGRFNAQVGLGLSSEALSIFFCAVLAV